MTKLRAIRPLTIRQLRARAKYPTAEDAAASVYAEMKPAGRMTVTEAGQEYTKIGSGGGSAKPWSIDITPYMKDVQDTLTSLDFTGAVFVGPARTGKTLLDFNWISHTVKTDPSDMLFVNMDRDNARKWSQGDLDRYLRASPEIRKEQITSRQYDNTFDKTFKSGMRILITYPTPSNLSQLTVGKVALNDYDRMDDDIGGEGNPFDLAKKRTQTFKRFGMTFAESSPNPNKEVQDPRWMAPPGSHEAPPIRGIFELYNRGDRRRYQWCCPLCEHWFEPDFKLLDYGGLDEPMEARDATVMICPNPKCRGRIEPRHKFEMNRHGLWIKQGEMVEPGYAGVVVPVPGSKILRSSIASWWLKGPAAAYQDWGELVENYVRALKTLEDTFDDAPLRKTVTTDQGTFYIPLSRLSERTPEDLKHRAEDWGSTEENPTVPAEVRFMIATVDVQAKSFAVQVHGFCDNRDIVVIDSFKVRLSHRLNASGDRLPIDPAAFGEDWDVLTSEVLARAYPLADDSGRRMSIRAVGCDSGGKEGVTKNAYDFWRRLRRTEDGLHRRFCLVKGEPSKSAPRAQTHRPDSGQTKSLAIARGDIPVIFLNSNTLKDDVAMMLSRAVKEPGETEARSGKMRWPAWIPDWFYTQMTTEIRTPKGWDNPRKRRNECFDLAYYALGMAIRPFEKNTPHVLFDLDRLNFDEPPSWAAEWAENSLVFKPEPEPVTEEGQGGFTRPQPPRTEKKRTDFTALGEKFSS